MDASLRIFTLNQRLSRYPIRAQEPRLYTILCQTYPVLFCQHSNAEHQERIIKLYQNCHEQGLSCRLLDKIKWNDTILVFEELVNPADDHAIVLHIERAYQEPFHQFFFEKPFLNLLTR